MIGTKINNLTIIEDLGRVLYKTASGFKRNRHRVIVECICGKRKEVSLGELKCRQQVSCGCMKKRNKKHGLRYEPLYLVFDSMKSRCYNPKDSSYNRYGGRGINICDEWLNDFSSFYHWSIINGWQKGLQIDRINNDGNYKPENCRFVTPKENCNNKSNNVFLEYKDVKKPILIWCKEFNINFVTLSDRLKSGWTVEKALETPVNFRVTKLEYNGYVKTVKEWSNEIKVPVPTIERRIHKYNWTIERALTTPVRTYKTE